MSDDRQDIEIHFEPDATDYLPLAIAFFIIPYKVKSTSIYMYKRKKKYYLYTHIYTHTHTRKEEYA